MNCCEASFQNPVSGHNAAGISESSVSPQGISWLLYRALHKNSPIFNSDTFLVLQPGTELGLYVMTVHEIAINIGWKINMFVKLSVIIAKVFTLMIRKFESQTKFHNLNTFFI